MEWGVPNFFHIDPLLRPKLTCGPRRQKRQLCSIIKFCHFSQSEACKQAMQGLAYNFPLYGEGEDPEPLTVGISTLHGTETQTGTEKATRINGFQAKMFTLVQDKDRDQDPLFPIVPVPFPYPAPVPVSFPRSVNQMLTSR